MSKYILIKTLTMTSIAICAAFAECAGAQRLGGTTFPKRKPKKSYYQERVDKEKKEKEKARQQDKSDREKAKATNPQRMLKITNFCGYKFGEPGEDRTEPNRKPFGGYDTATLKYYEGIGLAKITVINKDPDRIKDVRKEIDRIMKMCERNFNILFTKGISSRNNAEKAHHYGSGHTLFSMETKSATHWWLSASEEFKDFTISIKGENDVNGQMFVELSIFHDIFKDQLAK